MNIISGCFRYLYSCSIKPDSQYVYHGVPTKVKIVLENKFIHNIFIYDGGYRLVNIEYAPEIIQNIIDTWFSLCSNGKYMAKYGLYVQLEKAYNRYNAEWYHDHVTEIIFKIHNGKSYPLVGNYLV